MRTGGPRGRRLRFGRLQAMVGFRKIAVHRYHALDLRILRAILDERLHDLLGFADLVEQSPG